MKIIELKKAKKKEINEEVKIKGRVLAKRSFKKIVFLKIIDDLCEDQIIFKNEIEKTKKVKLGDIVISRSKVFTNNNGIKCFLNIRFKIVVQNNVLVPDKRKNIINKEQYYRKSYIRIATNINEKKKIYRRFKAIETIRKFMRKKKFLEVETPILSEMTEGSDSKPFLTEHNSLKKKMFLRISPELNLKKMLISGFEKIFEIGKNFRNEGISKRHYPEFLNLEFYRTYKNYRWGMVFLEELLKCLADFYIKEGVTNRNVKAIRSNRFEIITIEEAIFKYGKIKMEEINDKKKLLLILKEKKYINYSLEKIKFIFFEKKVSKKIMGPTFVIEYPIFSSPLAKINKKKKKLDRFELYISGIEIANGFSELNNFIEQKERFKKQKNLNKKKINENFIESMKFGMPPACGCGLGIDRIIMILENLKSIKEILVLPELR
ncbi:Lysyl-tRNA synthetase (class II) [Candidatus Vidania fulgoroideae]|nr:Lysyl-tRNA synthetase (class II) [Candidatus Vidania fulgoroideae]